MENNHPVVSPSGNIRLVHNGVLWNHREVRGALGMIGKKLPEVDSSVLPALIEELGLENTDLISGDAAAAWFDRDTGAAIHLARFSHSPVSVAVLEDGSFAFASTDRILANALDRVGVRWFGTYPDPFYTMDDGEYFQVYEGKVINQSKVEWGPEYGRYASNVTSLRHVTSGGGGWSDVAGTEDTTPMYLGGTTSGAAVGTPNKDEPEGELEHVNPNVLFSPPEDVEDIQAVFWTRSHGGDYVEYTNVATLLAAIRWYSGLKDGIDLVGDDAGFVRWINHFEDIGELQDDDKGNPVEISWIMEPNEMLMWGDVIPSYVRDGVEELSKYVKA